MKDSLLATARSQFHAALIDSGTLAITPSKLDGKNILISSNADKDNRSSREIALHIAEALAVPPGPKLQGQTLGKNFEYAVSNFLRECLPLFANTTQEKDWQVSTVGSTRNADNIGKFLPYHHLAALSDAIVESRLLSTVLGNSYAISPDILITRPCLKEDTLNRFYDSPVIDNSIKTFSPLVERSNHRTQGVKRSEFGSNRFIHAVISCKWTMRSDRAQNTRSEALNYLKNRKGRAPHIVAVTAEPTLSRISSLALGTGEIDMIYHAFLPELIAAVSAVGSDDAKEMLETLVQGQRLRDIADLPLDLRL